MAQALSGIRTVVIINLNVKLKRHWVDLLWVKRAWILGGQHCRVQLDCQRWKTFRFLHNQQANRSHCAHQNSPFRPSQKLDFIFCWLAQKDCRQDYFEKENRLWISFSFSHQDFYLSPASHQKSTLDSLPLDLLQQEANPSVLILESGKLPQSALSESESKSKKRSLPHKSRIEEVHILAQRFRLHKPYAQSLQRWAACCLRSVFPRHDGRFSVDFGLEKHRREEGNRQSHQNNDCLHSYKNLQLVWSQNEIA